MIQVLKKFTIDYETRDMAHARIHSGQSATNAGVVWLYLYAPAEIRPQLCIAET
jgi:hypothetical protein